MRFESWKCSCNTTQGAPSTCHTAGEQDHWPCFAEEARAATGGTEEKGKTSKSRTNWGEDDSHVIEWEWSVENCPFALEELAAGKIISF